MQARQIVRLKSIVILLILMLIPWHEWGYSQDASHSEVTLQHFGMLLVEATGDKYI